MLDEIEIILENEVQLVEAAFGWIKIFDGTARTVIDELKRIGYKRVTGEREGSLLFVARAWFVYHATGVYRMMSLEVSLMKQRSCWKQRRSITRTLLILAAAERTTLINNCELLLIHECVSEKNRYSNVPICVC